MLNPSYASAPNAERVATRHTLMAFIRHALNGRDRPESRRTEGIEKFSYGRDERAQGAVPTATTRHEGRFPPLERITVGRTKVVTSRSTNLCRMTGRGNLLLRDLTRTQGRSVKNRPMAKPKSRVSRPEPYRRLAESRPVGHIQVGPAESRLLGHRSAA